MIPTQLRTNNFVRVFLISAVACFALPAFGQTCQDNCTTNYNSCTASVDAGSGACNENANTQYQSCYQADQGNLAACLADCDETCYNHGGYNDCNNAFNSAVVGCQTALTGAQTGCNQGKAQGYAGCTSSQSQCNSQCEDE